MAENEIVHVAIAPPGTHEEGLVEKAAAVISKDIPDTRLLLAGDIPRIITHCQSSGEAGSIADSLRELGIVSFICSDSELHRPVQSFRAHIMQFENGDVLFRDKGGREIRLGAEDIFLILKGRKQTYTGEEITKTRMKFSLPATVLTGGIPIWRRVSEHSSDQSQSSEYFIRLYGRRPSQTGVEILQNHMNYSFLGAKMTFSSLTNFNALSLQLRDLFPQANFDDRLTKYREVSVPSAGGMDDLEVKLRLIYMYYLARSGFK